MKHLGLHQRVPELTAVAGGLSILVYYILTEAPENIWYATLSILVVAALPFVLNSVDRMVWGVVLLAPISVPLSLPFFGLRMSFPSEMLTGIVLLVFLVKSLAGMRNVRSVVGHPVAVLLLLGLFWSFLSAFQSELGLIAVKRAIMKTLFVGGFFFVFAYVFRDGQKQRMLYLLYGIGALYPIAHTFYVHTKFGLGQATSVMVSQPYFADHTIYGACMTFLLPFFLLGSGKVFSNKHRGFYLMMVIILLLAIIFSYSRASWISLIFTGLFYLGVRLKMEITHVLALVLVVAVVCFTQFDAIYQELRANEVKYSDDVGAHLTSVTNLQNDASNLERINRWVCAYRMFEDKPLFGHGPGTYQFIYDRYQTAEFMTHVSTHQGDQGNAHSEYLTILSEEGLTGLIIFLVLVIYTLHLGLSLLARGVSGQQRQLVLAALLGLVTFFVHGLFNMFGDYEKMAVLTLGSMAILVNVHLETRDSTGEDGSTKNLP